MEPTRDRPRFELSARLVAIIGVMIAVVFVATFSVKIPIPGGYIHFGDIAIYFASFIFGPIVGVLAGAIGPTLSDLLSYPSYAPGTFVIHGLQGLVAGMIGWRAGVPRMILAVIAGGAIIVGGYFLYDLAVVPCRPRRGRDRCRLQHPAGPHRCGRCHPPGVGRAASLPADCHLDCPAHMARRAGVVVTECAG